MPNVSTFIILFCQFSQKFFIFADFSPTTLKFPTFPSVLVSGHPEQYSALDENITPITYTTDPNSICFDVLLICCTM